MQSPFDSKTTQYYADCLVQANEKGAVEIDDQQRRNVVFCPSTGSSLGSKFKWGRLASLPDTVLVVKTSASSQINGFLEDSSKYTDRRCVRCARRAGSQQVHWLVRRHGTFYRIRCLSSHSSDCRIPSPSASIAQIAWGACSSNAWQTSCTAMLPSHKPRCSSHSPLLSCK